MTDARCSDRDDDGESVFVFIPGQYGTPAGKTVRRSKRMKSIA